MIRTFIINWLCRILGIPVEFAPVTEETVRPALRVKDRFLTAHYCANNEGRSYTRPEGVAADGWFWKRDRASPLYRLYRIPVREY